MMNNYKLQIQYDGTNYAGWQMQANAVSIQQKIVEAIEVITKETVNLIGSGRTDAGVHALGQIANFRTEKKIDMYKFSYSLNSILPNDIAIKSVEKVDESFHARFNAKSRSYIYLIAKGKSPFYNSYSYLYPRIAKIDLKKLNGLSKILIGNYDFTSFSKKNTEIENKFCEVSEILWRDGKDLSTFYITANRFLHGMARTIVGTLLKAVEMENGRNYLQDILEKKNRKEADESVPAKGLFLFKVRY